MYCVKCGKQIKVKEAERCENFCKVCYRDSEKYKAKQVKRIKSLSLAILVILLIGIILYMKFSDLSKEVMNIENYSLNNTIYSVVKVNDDYFEEQKDDKYKDYDLMFISFTLKNQTSRNYEHLTYKLVTKDNTYANTTGAYITTDNIYLVEDFLKIIEQSSNNTKMLLGEEEKKKIIAFLVPKHELKEGNEFTLKIEGDDVKAQPIRFLTSDIVESNNLKQLFNEEELSIVEQRISLYYIANNLMNATDAQISAWNSGNIKTLDLYLNVAIECLNLRYPLNWNGQYLAKGENGYNLNYTKCKKAFPKIKEDIANIESSKKGQQNAKNQLVKYNNIGSITYSEYTNNVYGIRASSLNIKNYLNQ